MYHKIQTMPLTSENELERLGIENSNYSLVVASGVDEVLSAEADPQYEQFLADVWVGIILTLIVLSCVCCMCSCLLYHKFQQWKRNILATRNALHGEIGPGDSESLPSYTIASGLPSYQEALEQLKKVREETAINTNIKIQVDSTTEPWVPHTPPTPMARLSVVELFQFYRTPSNATNAKS